MKKIKIKNSTLLIGAGGLFLIIGVFFLITQKQNTIAAPVSELLSQDEANALVSDKTNALIELYENPIEVFKVKEHDKTKAPNEEDIKENVEDPTKAADTQKETDDEDTTIEHPDYYEIENYDDIVKSIFTENGIKELEETKFGDKNFVIKENNKVYILKEIPEENRYKGNNFTIGTTKILKESVTSEITITSYNLNDDMLTYYVINKNLSLAKDKDTWLVDSFYYNNK